MKARKQGNTLVLSIPTKLNVVEGTEYMVMKESDGSLVFTPKAENIFKGGNKDLRPETDYLSGSSTDREDV